MCKPPPVSVLHPSRVDPALLDRGAIPENRVINYELPSLDSETEEDERDVVSETESDELSDHTSDSSHSYDMYSASSSDDSPMDWNGVARGELQYSSYFLLFTLDDQTSLDMILTSGYDHVVVACNNGMLWYLVYYEVPITRAQLVCTMDGPYPIDTVQVLDCFLEYQRVFMRRFRSDEMSDVTKPSLLVMERGDRSPWFDRCVSIFKRNVNSVANKPLPSSLPDTWARAHAIPSNPHVINCL